VEELRRQVDRGAGGAAVASGVGDGDDRRFGVRSGGFIGEAVPVSVSRVTATPAGGGAIGPRDESPPPNVVTIAPGTKMPDVERAVIEAALKETRGNRRRAAELLGIGERTLYRKIKEYRLPELEYSLD
jgi:transcriptional regulator with AAA-type ATPase domain